MIVRVMIVDDHPVVVEGLRELLRHQPDVAVVAQAGSVREAIQKASQERPDLVLMDVRLPDGNGIDATRVIRERLPRTQVLVLSVYEDRDMALNALRAGAVGYLLKDILPEHLMRAIRSVQSEGTLVHTMIATKLVEQASKPRNGSRDLSEREIAILQGVAAGLSDKGLASKLLLAESTVKGQLRALYRKLGIQNRAQAAIFTVREGLDEVATTPFGAPAPTGGRHGDQGLPVFVGEALAARKSG